MTTSRITWARDIEPSARRNLNRWGPWLLATDYPALEHLERGYEVSLLECRTAAQCLDWIAQIANKTWADATTVAGLVHALDDVLSLQASVCPSGRPRTLTRDQIRRRSADATRWAPLSPPAGGAA